MPARFRSFVWVVHAREGGVPGYIPTTVHGRYRLQYRLGAAADLVSFFGQGDRLNQRINEAVRVGVPRREVDIDRSENAHLQLYLHLLLVLHGDTTVSCCSTWITSFTHNHGLRVFQGGHRDRQAMLHAPDDRDNGSIFCADGLVAVAVERSRPTAILCVRGLLGSLPWGALGRTLKRSCH